jgi:hypothetical protein
MKTFLAITLMAFVAGAQAHKIDGTLVLKGTVKTKIVVNRVKSVCKLKVQEVKNLMQEDSFGNPAYDLRVDISLSGSDFDRGLKVKYDQDDIKLNNLFEEGSELVVKDLKYKSVDGTIFMNIDSNGRIRNVQFPYQLQKITCEF